MNVPSVTIEQMRKVDRIMIEEIGVSILMMMENASRNIAALARRMLGKSVNGKHVVILCGKGNNGGDGLGAARHLTNFGAACRVFLSTPVTELSTEARIQYNVLSSMNVEVNDYGAYSNEHLTSHLLFTDLIIDALLGYNLKGSPKEPIAYMISAANDSRKPILAVDIPSGLDGDTGEPHSPTIKAAATLTLALPKVGLLTEKAKEYVGELYLADLSVPKVVYDKLGLKVGNIFEREEIVKVWK